MKKKVKNGPTGTHTHMKRVKDGTTGIHMKTVKNGAAFVQVGFAAKAVGEVVCGWLWKFLGICFCSNPLVVAAVGVASIVIIGLAATPFIGS
jgi:hypothetical protein